METYDITIIGAGPVGLYAGFYAGMRGLSVNIIEIFDEAGGQPKNLYPEKYIYDIAGLPKISGEELTKNLLEQIGQIDYDLHLSEAVEDIVKQGDIFTIKTDKAEYKSHSILMTTGNGLIKPRKLDIDGEDELHESGKLAYYVKNLESYRDQSVAVLGGGDSALDWALMLEDVAKEVKVIHRRPNFRAHELTIEKAKNSTLELVTPYTVGGFTDQGLLLKKVRAEEELEISADKILVTYGFITNPSEVVQNLELTRNGKIPVDQEMKSAIDGIYAAGDASTFEGKVPLITVGFGETVTAITAITKRIHLEHAVKKGHSSSLFG